MSSKNSSGSKRLHSEFERASPFNKIEFDSFNMFSKKSCEETYFDNDEILSNGDSSNGSILIFLKTLSLFH